MVAHFFSCGYTRPLKERAMPTLTTDEQILKQLDILNDYLHQIVVGRPPIFSVVQLSSTMPYVIDYQERRHVYIWLPSSSLALSFEDYGSGTVQAQVWTNLGLPEGIRVFATTQTSGTTPMYVKCTDEVIA